MARSLTVTTEDKPTTNWLLTGFLLLAVGFLALGAVVAVAFADDAEAGDTTAVSRP
jgi:hypothetical protein